MLDIQRASIFKRIFAFILDFILMVIVATGVGLLISKIVNFDEQYEKFVAVYDYYDEKYDIDLLGKTDKYDDLNEEEQKAYDERLNQANLEWSTDATSQKQIYLVFNLTLIIITISLLVSVLILEFVVPLFLKDGQTIGKKIFSICIVKNNCVKMTNFQLFVRSIIGKYTIEIMIPVLIVIAIAFGAMGIIGLIVLALMLIVQIVLLFGTKNHTVIHDAFAYTIVVDKESQKIFANEEEMIKYKQKLHEEEVRRIKSY